MTRVQGKKQKKALQCTLLLAVCSILSIAEAQDDDELLEELFRRNDPALVAPVVIDGETLLQVRGVSAYPAEERAETIRQQVISIARESSISLDSGRIETEPDRISIYFGDALAVSLYSGDAVLEDVELPLLAEAVQERLTAAILEYRERRSSEMLGRSTVFLLLQTLVAALLAYLTFKAFGWLNRVVSKRAASAGKRLGEASQRLIEGRQVVLWSLGLMKSLLAILLVVILLVWLHSALSLYPWTQPFASSTFALVLNPLRILGLGLLNQIPNLAFLVVLGFVTRFVLAGAKHVFERIHYGALRIGEFEQDWAMPTYRIARLLILSFALIVAYPYIPGSSSEAFRSVSIFLGVVFSIGSTSFIASFIAGYFIIYRRAFRKGDFVKVGELMGRVVETRTLSTQIRSIKNELINIPNATVLNSEITNFSSLQHESGLILHTAISIGYDVSWRQVEHLLLEAAERTEGLKREPLPFVLRKSLDDFAVVYELNAFCGNAERMFEVYSALHSNILDAFNDAEVQIMSPHYMLDPEVPKIADKNI